MSPEPNDGTETAGDSGGHATADLLGRYLRQDPALPETAVWSLETHLESCVDCRASLAAALPAEAPAVAALVRDSLEAIRPGLAVAPPAPRRRWSFRLVTWAAPAMVPWVVGAMLIALLTGLFGTLAPMGHGRDLVLLLAPMVPVLGVAAAWSAGLDPAHELVAATPRAGLYLVLRRTLAVLVPVIPVLALAGLPVGASPVLWLLPCLACTAGTLALGSAIGVERAAVAVAACWVLTLVLPALVNERLPVALEPRLLPAWAGAAALAAGLVLVRGPAFTRLVQQRTRTGER